MFKAFCGVITDMASPSREQKREVSCGPVSYEL